MIRSKWTVPRTGKTAVALARTLARAGFWSFVGAGAAATFLVLVPASASPVVARSRAFPKAFAVRAGASASALGPGDVISVRVLRHQDVTNDAVTIPESGRIEVPLTQGVQVTGLSPSQAAAKIARALSGQIIAPEVTVELKTARPRYVSVLGAVAKTNSYAIQPGWRISEALTAAGGLPGRLDETAGTLTHAGALQAPIRIDLKAVVFNPSSPKNLRLREGDTLSFFALATKTVTVSGDVAKPGAYALRNAPRLLDALTLAGKIEGRPEDMTATLTRAGRVQTLDIAAVQGDAASPQNIKLQAGDILLFQAHDPKTVTVTGDVQRQGAYPLRSARTLLDALAQAEGPKESPARTRITLFHKNGKSQPLDLVQAQQQNTPDTNVSLKDGDLLMVQSVPLLQVTVSGPFVRSAGNFQLLPGSSAVQAVAQAAGLTVNADQVDAHVIRAGQNLPFDYARAINDPRADVPLQSGDTVLINEPTIIRVQVAGAVNKQGALRVAPGTTLLDALNGSAGGLSIPLEEARVSVVRRMTGGAQLVGFSLGSANAPSAPDAASAASAGQTQSATGAPQIQVIGDREVIAVNALGLLRQSDLRQNVTLQDGDLISVTQVKNPTVIVSGEVAKPGPYQINPGEGFVQLLARAGNITPNAALTRVVLQRGGQSRVLDVYDEVKGQKPSVALEDGDTVIVPQNTSLVKVMNAVVKPGDYAIPERGVLRVTDAIALAGGPRDRAGVRQVGLLRPSPGAPGGVEQRILNLDKIRTGDLSQDVVLRPGDIVFVPEAKTPRPGLLASLGQVIGTFTGLRYLAGQ